MEPKPTLKGRLIAIFAGLVFLAGLSEVGVRIAFPEWRDFYSGRFLASVDVEGRGRLSIGRPGFDGYFAQNNGDFRVHVRINEFGLRNDEPVEEAADRIWVVGDSLTFGWGVEAEEMYSSVTGRLSGFPSYNVASPGTDVCGYQSLVRRMPDALRPRAVIVGLVIEGDIRDYRCRERAVREAAAQNERADTEFFGLTELKFWLTGSSAIYNYVAVMAKRVGFIVNALTSLGLVNQEHVNTPTFDVARIDQLAESSARELAALKRSLADGAAFGVLVVPARYDIRDGDRALGSARQKTILALEAQGISVIDPYSELKAAGFRKIFFRHDGHWSALGHAIAGKVAAEWLKRELKPN